MASAIDATVGGANANSYVTLEEATTYMGDRLYKDAWLNAGTSDKTAALLWACRVIDSRVEWKGQRAEPTQALAWPRVYVPNPDPALIPAISQPFGYPLADYLPGDAVPNDIKHAQCEMALALLQSDVTAEPGGIGLNSLAVGSLKLDFGGNSAQPKTFPRQVDEVLRRYGFIRSANSGVRKLVRS